MPVEVAENAVINTSPIQKDVEILLQYDSGQVFRSLSCKSSSKCGYWYSPNAEGWWILLKYDNGQVFRRKHQLFNLACTELPDQLNKRYIT